MSPLRRLSVQVLLRPLLSRSTTAASASVGRDPRCPPAPGFPAPACVASAPRAFRITAASIPHAPKQTGQSFGPSALSPPQRSYFAGREYEIKEQEITFAQQLAKELAEQREQICQTLQSKGIDPSILDK
ncbi:hypothetical protein PGTUg99_017140 [Puccinia graminis f. sp. tritici]|uniref:Uncharacterized protein n=1 Tax=Puccinia graminis f. sp. tritici TaxID=56615 RepID=A0A5B0MPR5_PUCGR|nr:hypothetical protein PGTUg99_017140 [Puccinia graminis f. sp. tritici]